MNRPFDGVDTAAKINARIADILKREGYSFVARYLVPESLWKALTAQEAADPRAVDGGRRAG